MKKAIDTLLAAATILPVILLFWPFAMWNDVMAVILRVIPALATQILLFRIGKRNIVKVLPALLTGAGAAWGTYLYFTSPHWSNATFWGSLVADYASPFLSCVAALIACRFVQKPKKTNAHSPKGRDSMKKLLYFIPTLLIAIFFLFLLFILGGHTNLSDAYITAIVILSIFGVSDWLLSRQKWYGCVLGALFGAYIIYYGSQYHGQVFDERPIGAVICLYYLIRGIVTYQKTNPHK